MLGFFPPSLGGAAAAKMGTERTKVKEVLVPYLSSLLAFRASTPDATSPSPPDREETRWVLLGTHHLLFPIPASHPTVVFVTYCQASGQEQQDPASDSSTLENRAVDISNYSTVTFHLHHSPFTRLPNPFSAQLLRANYLWQQLWNIGVPSSWELLELSGNGRKKSHHSQGGMYSGRSRGRAVAFNED